MTDLQRPLEATLFSETYNNKALCTRKKKVPNAYQPDSNRIFQDGITDKSVYQHHRAHTAAPCLRSTKNPAAMNFDFRSDPRSYWKGKADEIPFKNRTGFIRDHPKEPSRRNCPHPNSANFLRSNVMILNDAIPKVSTDAIANDQTDWWRHSHGDRNNNSISTIKSKSKLGEETAGRSLFRMTAKPSDRSAPTGPKSNPYNLPKIERKKQPAASDWILRHNTSDDKKFLEHISYRHGYNRRFYKHEPIRGKLPGNFVWKELRSSKSTEK